MELNDFVAQALVQICEGIKKAQGQGPDLGAIISPRIDNVKGDVGSIRLDHEPNLSAMMINFDVAVTTSESASTEKGGILKGSLQVVAAKLGGEVGKSVASEAQSSTVSRIQFSIPVRFPEQLVGHSMNVNRSQSAVF